MGEGQWERLPSEGEAWARPGQARPGSSEGRGGGRGMGGSGWGTGRPESGFRGADARMGGPGGKRPGLCGGSEGTRSGEQVLGGTQSPS